MEWLTCIRKAIEYMEEHLKDGITAQDVGKAVYVSPLFLQKGFTIMTGYGIGEYLRNRRLYEAAKDLVSSEDKVIDIALRYGYETPESFTKAFTRFHGSTPSEIRSGSGSIVSFVPLRINISIEGGYLLNYKIERREGFKVIGFEKAMAYEETQKEIPEFWDEIFRKYVGGMYEKVVTDCPKEEAIRDNGIGEYGICMDYPAEDKVRYLIAGKYAGKEIPEGMVTYDVPEGEWAIFDCIGPVPEELQKLNAKIFSEWLPGNPDYEIDGNVSIEWYDPANGDLNDAKTHTQVWVPVKRR